MIDIDSILPKKKILNFCKKHSYILKLSLFGSALSGEMGPNSDVDLLVEFEPGKTPSLFTIINLENELADLTEKKIDLRTKEELSRYFRDEVVSKSMPLYVKS